jgi:uncharacterized protein (DUF488 family)
MNKALEKNGTDLVLYTIGHSNLQIERFIELLKSNYISCVVDVRSIPYSKHNRNFEKNNLSYELVYNGIEYVWMGETLGGRREVLKTSLGFRQDDRYDSDPDYTRGVLELVHRALTKPTAMMCSEEDPRRCHRHKIIANTLLHNKMPELYQKFDNIKITHIRANGRIEDASLIEIYFQPSLFD